jgi:hypothetical protein
MTDLATRISTLAAASVARDQSKRDSVRERFPEFAAWADAIRADLPGRWQAWAIRAEGLDMRGGDQQLLTGTWVDLTPPRTKVKRA